MENIQDLRASSGEASLRNTWPLSSESMASSLLSPHRSIICELYEVSSAKYCYTIDKILLLRKSCGYLHQTNTSEFTIISTVKRTKSHSSITIICRISWVRICHIPFRSVERGRKGHYSQGTETRMAHHDHIGAERDDRSDPISAS